MRQDEPDDSPLQVLEAIDPVSSDSDEEREEIMCPFDRGTVFMEKSTDITLVSPIVSSERQVADAR
jgi:hypothetical protein